jgi:sugar phosphate isomerase/epimerase
MKYGLMSSCMPGSYEHVIRECTEIGFDGVELDVGADYEDNLLWQPEGRQRIKHLLSSAQMELASVCLGAFWTYSFANPEAEVRRRAQGFTADAIRWCAELGAKVILVPVTPGAADEDQEQARSHWIIELRKVAPLAEKSQVFLAVENVGRGCGKTAEGLLAIVQRVNSPYVQVYYDFGNGLSLSGDPVAEIEKLDRRIVQVHAKDPGGQYLGEGRLDLPAVSAALKRIGYDGYLVLETPATPDPTAAARRNLDFLKEDF